MRFIDSKHKGLINEYTGNGIHCFGGVRYFEANLPTGTITGGVPDYALVEISQQVGIYSATNDKANLTEISLDPYSLNLSSANATLENVTVWSANSILTRDYADARYAPIQTTIDGGSATTTNTGTYDGGSAFAN